MAASEPPISPASSASLDQPDTPDGEGSLVNLSSLMGNSHLQSNKEKDTHSSLQNGHVKEAAELDEPSSLHEDAIKANVLHSNDDEENALQRLHRQHTGLSTASNADSDHLFLKGDEDDDEVLEKTTSREATTEAEEPIIPNKMTDEEVLNAIEKEMGPWTCNAEGLAEKEVVIAQEVCILMRKVLIRGYSVLTNHRLCFVAFLPTNMTEEQPNHQHDRGIIRASPAILHRPGLTRRKRKAWFVLTKHSITAYPSSEEMYEPLGGVRLSDIQDVSPTVIHGKHAISFKIKGNNAQLEFETEEAAAHWIKEIDIARWRLTNEIDKVRVSIPLVRIAGVRMQDTLDVCKMVYLSILDDDLYSSSGHPHHDHIHIHRKENESSPQGSSMSEIVFGYLLKPSTSIIELEKARDRAQAWRASRVKSDWWSLPPAIIEIDGAQFHSDDATESTDESQSVQMRIIDQFSLDCKPDQLQLVKAEIVRTIPSAGTLALSPRYLCFYRRHRLTGLADTRIKIPIQDINKVMVAKAFRWHHYALRLQIHAHGDLVFEFHQQEHRDEASRLLQEAVTSACKHAKELQSQDKPKQRNSLTPQGHALAKQAEHAIITLSPKVINQFPRAVNVHYDDLPLRVQKMKIICLTIGSRGDVQPYIALCKQLQQHDHECIIVSHGEYKEWVEGYGIGFRAAGGDPGELMKLSVENSMFSPNFFREAISKFRHWLDELLRDIMETCWDADLLIESPSTFGGIHVAEAVGCYYMRAFTMPWTKTSAYPQAFSVPSVDMGPQYNLMSYSMFDQILWTASSGQINRWRKHMLKLGSTDMNSLKIGSVPFMYNFSPAVVPPPLDWGSLTAVTGYWEVKQDNNDKYDAPKALVDFIAKAKKDNKKLAYIGFGSIPISDARGTQKAIYEAVQKSNVRAIVSKGWSERMGKKKEEGEEEGPLEVPEEVYTVDSIPHDWLFGQIDIAMHHGGAGTTGASLRAGLVTLIHPFFGDQSFWSGRVDKLGAGLRVKSLKMDTISEALIKARDDRVMREKAQLIGQSIQQEHGVESAVEFIYVNLERSKRTPRPLKMDQKQSESSHPAKVWSSDEYESEVEEVDAILKRRPSKSTSFTNALHLNGIKRAASRPMESLLGKNGRGRSPLPTSSKKRVESPDSIHEVLSSDDEEHKEDDHAKTRSNWLALHHGLSFQRPSNMPHMSMPGILKMGFGNDGKDGDEHHLTEEEKERERKESREKHLSAKEEDEKRREALVEIWKKAGRTDLLREPASEEGKRNSTVEKMEGKKEVPSE